MSPNNLTPDQTVSTQASLRPVVVAVLAAKIIAASILIVSVNLPAPMIAADQVALGR